MIDMIINSFDIWTEAQGVKSKTRVKSVDNISHQGILKLRELILTLAFQGKLLKQNKNDVPALNILKRIEIKLGCKIKTNSNSQYDIPANWEWCRIGDISSHNTGKTLDARRNKGELKEYITTSNLYWGFFKLSNLQKMAISESEMGRCTAVKGDLLICEGGEAGRSAVWENDNPICFQNHIHRVRPFEEINPYYLYYYMMKIFYSGEIQNYRQGVGISSMSGRALSSITLPLSPLEEQSRIVLKIKELFALCDMLEREKFRNLKTHQVLVKTLLASLTQVADVNELQASWERLSAHFDTLFCTDDSIDQLKQTILQLAVMGKLVKQDPEDEPASELLKKIAKEKERLIEDGKLKKQTPLAEISEDEKMFTLPKGWEWKRLNDVIDVRDGTHDSPKEAFGDNTYPLITSQNFENGNINFDTAKRISEEDHIEISKRSFVEPFDILFSMIGGNLGNQLMVNTDRPFSVKNVALFKYYCKDYTFPYFIKKIMEYIALTLQSRAIGGAQPFVALGFLRDIVIALPPIEEQKRIVKKVDELFTLCESLKEKIKKSQEIKVLLSKTIVEKAV